MGEDQQRLFLTIAICLGIMLVWTYLFGPEPRPPGQGSPAPAAGPGVAGQGSPASPGAAIKEMSTSR